MALLTIGAFARAAGLSPKALRLYDELGLLAPAAVDPGSGYRFYHPDQLEPARLIAWLRRLGMPLARIRAVVRLDHEGAARLVEAYWSEVVAETDPYCQEEGCMTIGPLPLDHQSVLAPGAYVIEASAAGSATPFYFAGNFIPIGSSGAYQLELTNVAVPALGLSTLPSRRLAATAVPMLAERLGVSQA